MAQVPAATSARVIVRMRSAASTSAQILSATTTSGIVAPLRNAQSLSQRIGSTLADGHSIDAHTQLVYAAGITSEALAAKLRALDDVEFAVPDQRKRAFAAPNDPLYPAGQTATTPAAGQWYLHAPTTTTPASINAEVAWAITPGSASIVIADIDTGVRFDHPDLAAKLLPGYDFISDVPTANDGDGRDGDASDPGDWITAAEDAQSGGEFQGCGQSDSSWHGTETAGLLGASTNNGLGMASIGHDVMVMPLRALGKCGGYDSDIQAAMLWAAGISVPGVPVNTHPARVINMSLGGAGACEASYQSVLAQVTAAGVVVVASAGNDGLAVNSPADCPGVIAVAGLRHFGSKVGYSSLGPEVALSAPAGNCVNATGTCLYPLLTTRNTGHHNAARQHLFRRRREPVARHELLGAAGRRHGRAHDLAQAQPDPGASAERAQKQHTHLPEQWLRFHRVRLSGAERDGADFGVLLHDHHLWRRNARRRRGADAGRREHREHDADRKHRLHAGERHGRQRCHLQRQRQHSAVGPDDRRLRLERGQRHRRGDVHERRQHGGGNADAHRRRHRHRHAHRDRQQRRDRHSDEHGDHRRRSCRRAEHPRARGHRRRQQLDP